jgi:hypothetical protein
VDLPGKLGRVTEEIEVRELVGAIGHLVAGFWIPVVASF